MPLSSVWFLMLAMGLSGPKMQDSTSGTTVRGRAVCLDPSDRPLSECPPEPTARFGLQTADGILYLFSTRDPRTIMLTDPRIRARDLEIVAWLRPENELEIINLYTVREGHLYDVTYRCDTCNITAHTPGKCWCCQAEFELREVPKAKP